MQKSDFSVVSIIYAIGLFFLYQTLTLPEDAQTYPLVLIIALLSVNTLYLAQSVYKWTRNHRVENDIAVHFNGFIPFQFFIVLGLCALYLVLMHFFGYYISTLVYLVGSLLFLRVPLLHILLTVGTIALMVALVFSMFLKVPLPVGTLWM